MIGWLQGRMAEPWQQANRCGVLLICQGVGYELLLTPRHWRQLPPEGSELALHVHLSVREDGWQLYGFAAREERDLFRELVAISGVGPQMALALLATLTAAELVEAIVRGDLRSLMRAQGVGRRTAERLAVELRARLQERFAALLAGPPPELEAIPDAASLPAAAGMEEVEETLTALGYEPLEIQRALRAVAAAGLVSAAAGPAGDGSHGGDGSEIWIRECLRWLSRPAA
ncbi:MAG: Holliday junction branch migration protein RuvA [Cyanobium sp.]